jgi:hypothetical protein
MIHRLCVAWLSLGLAAQAFAQNTVPAGIFTNRTFRPSLFVDRPARSWPDTTPRSMLDAARYSSYQTSYRGVYYYDSITDSPYGLDASRGLYQSTRVHGYLPQPTYRVDSWYGSTTVVDPYDHGSTSYSTRGTFP